MLMCHYTDRFFWVELLALRLTGMLSLIKCKQMQMLSSDHMAWKVSIWSWELLATLNWRKCTSFQTSCHQVRQTNDPLRESSQSKYGLLHWGMVLTQPSQLLQGAGFNQNTKMAEIGAWQQFLGFGRGCLWGSRLLQVGNQAVSVLLLLQTSKHLIFSFRFQFHAEINPPSWCLGCTS